MSQFTTVDQVADEFDLLAMEAGDSEAARECVELAGMIRRRELNEAQKLEVLRLCLSRQPRARESEGSDE